MGNIPNTNTPNLVLQSVGNGSNDSRWGTSGGGSTLPTGTGTGQMIWWNGTGWVVTITPTTGSYLYWNGTAWANAVAGNATSIDGYPVNVTGVGNGDVFYWSNPYGRRTTSILEHGFKWSLVTLCCSYGNRSSTCLE